jgi:flagellin
MYSASLANSIFNINNSMKMLDNYNLQIQTGKRINRAADDASGLTIADSLLTQANGLAAGTKNANDAKGMLNIADGALMTYGETLQLMKDKAVSAASDASSRDSRRALQADINNFMTSLNKIATDTEFNGVSLLNGTFTNKSFQVGAYAGQTVGISLMSASTSKLGHLTETTSAAVSAGTTAATLSINGATISQVTVSGTTKDGANLLASAINDQYENTGVKATAENSVTGVSVVGGAIADGDVSINGVSIGAVNVEANDDSGSLADAINAISNQTGVTASITGNGAIELTSMNGENIHITEANGGAAKAGLTAGTNYGTVSLTGRDGVSISNATAVSGLNAVTTDNYTLSDLDLTTFEGAERAMKIIDNAVSEVNRMQSNIGAATNQLDRVISVNEVTEQNVRAAESNIRDADLVKAQEQINQWTIKNQAAMYSFSMAQQTQQNILSILR